MNDKSSSPFLILHNAESEPPALWRSLQGPVFTVVRRPVDPSVLALAALERLARMADAQEGEQASTPSTQESPREPGDPSRHTR